MELKDVKKGLGAKKDRGIDIGEILTAPLIAASSANGMMLRDQTRFLMDYCFKKEENGSLSPILIPMKMTRSVTETNPETGETTSRQINMMISVPLLTVIPINTLSVQKVNVDFEMEVTNQVTEETTSDSSNSNTVEGANQAPQKAKLYGKISYDSREQNSRTSKGTSRAQNSSKLKVKIDAGQLPLPLGMTTMLEMYSKSIQPVQIENDKK